MQHKSSREIEMLNPDQTRGLANVVWWEANGMSYIQITYDKQSWQGSGHDLIAALTQVRQQFETNGHRLLCYGASLNSWPSGMSRDSDMVYQLTLGQLPDEVHSEDIHFIFDTGPDIIAATYQEQKAFSRRWHTAKRLKSQG